MSTPVRTRFAPSPTGSLHVGNARVAVLNWLVARHHGGSFILRIEDTDRERHVAGSEARILEDLRWLGLDWDEGPEVGGPHGPYHQSERLELYRDTARSLVEEGLAYPCYCTPEELEARREQALAAGRPPHYDGACRTLTSSARARLEGEGRTAALRFRVTPGRPVTIRDAVRGAVRFERSELGDFVIVRSDGIPTYNFAVVVDDAAMEVSHVIRGAGHLSNTPRQALLLDALDQPRPTYVHIPTVLGPDRRKLSKRHGARGLAEYRAEGFHPDAVVNYLSLLAWSSPSEDELLDRRRLVKEIGLDRIGASDVVFDPDKLRWLSGRHIDAMPLQGETPEDPAGLVGALLPFIDDEVRAALGDRLPLAVEAVRSHLSTFSEIGPLLRPFLPHTAGQARALPSSDARTRASVAAVRRALAGLERWEPAPIKAAVRAAGEEAGVRGADLYVPVRVVVTGEEHGPPLDAVLAVQGRDAVLDALDRALAEVDAETASG